MVKCEYGCGQDAKFFIAPTWNAKQKKHCCSSHRNACPAIQSKKRNKFLAKHGVESPNQLQSVKEKKKQTNLKKRGVENPSQSEEIKQKKIETTRKNFGVDHHMQLDSVRDQTKKTILERLGVDNPSKSPEVQSKRKQTNSKKFGGSSPMADPKVKEKVKKTCIEKYGVENASQSPEIQKKREQTNLEKFQSKSPFENEEVKRKIKETSREKYGVDWPSKSEESIKHRKETMLKRYGVESYSQLELVMQDLIEKRRIQTYQNLDMRNQGKAIPLFSENEYSDSSKLYSWKCNQGHVFQGYARHGLIPRCPVCDPIFPSSSRDEKDLAEFIKTLGFEVVENSKKIIPPLEIDVFIPEKKVGFEFHGLYWHSEPRKDQPYHQNKFLLAEKQNIQLIQIFEDEWRDKQELVKNRIKHILGFAEKKCGARRVTVCEIDSRTSKEFLEAHHVQGNINAGVRIGAYFDGNLVAVMTFGNRRKSMGAKKQTGEYELLRFAVDGNIPGLASKMFKWFLKEYDPNKVVSYCDLRWGTGRVYEQMGFQFSHTTKPNYFYLVKGKREPRFKYRKDQLVKEGFSPDLTEKQIMQDQGIDRIYDAGHKVFVWESKEKKEGISPLSKFEF